MLGGRFFEQGEPRGFQCRLDVYYSIGAVTYLTKTEKIRHRAQKQTGRIPIIVDYIEILGSYMSKWLPDE